MSGPKDVKLIIFNFILQVVSNANVTVNESVHLTGPIDYCEGVCEQSRLSSQQAYECWGFTFYEPDTYVKGVDLTEITRKKWK